ncbi:MAG TPA: aminotransferase class I/II-fold pyridoxal phosphate-dependent enzyme [Caulobacteraceae bacterium]|nr:aminotransferase class I/II-fold pyridoxal phosphate-dependent enzyme [Caulobacteraceae bacterium]
MSAKALPYGQHLIEADDLAAVGEALHADLVGPGHLSGEDARSLLADMAALPLTGGPRVSQFEAALAEAVDAPFAVACASGTSALHLILSALDVDGDSACVVPAITFLSTATAARLCGAEVVFADVDPETGLMRPQDLAEALGRAARPVKAALPVHLGGRACDMAGMAEVAAAHGVALVEDGCHALGTRAAGGRVGDGRFSAATAFSFHPVKTIACGEAGGVTTRDPALAARIQRLRNHGVTREAALLTDPELSIGADGAPNPWSYEQLELGFNYRMSELEAALGLSQIGKLARFVERRRVLSDLYDRLLAPLAPNVRPVARGGGESLHLYGVLIDFAALGLDRGALMRGLAARGIGTQVHYIPVYRQPYFTALYGRQRLAGAEAYYARALSLPLFPAMTDDDVRRVCAALAAELLKSER